MLANRSNKGFTLIELIAVILLTAILAAVAVPRFVDLSSAARQSAVDALAGQLASASSLNYVAFVLAESYSGAEIESAVPIENCDDIQRALAQQSLPQEYGLRGTGGSSGNVSHLTSVECDIFYRADPSTYATFVLYGVNPFGP